MYRGGKTPIFAQPQVLGANDQKSLLHSKALIQFCFGRSMMKWVANESRSLHIYISDSFMQVLLRQGDE